MYFNRVAFIRLRCRRYIVAGAIPDQLGAWDTRLSVLSLFPADFGSITLFPPFVIVKYFSNSNCHANFGKW